MTQTLPPAESLNEFYRLKNKYESTYHDKYVIPILKSNNKTKKEKRMEFTKLPKPTKFLSIVMLPLGSVITSPPAPLTDLTGKLIKTSSRLVIRPCASTVILAFVYEPAETAVLAKLTVEPLAVCDTDVPVPAEILCVTDGLIATEPELPEPEFITAQTVTIIPVVG